MLRNLLIINNRRDKPVVFGYRNLPLNKLKLCSTYYPHVVGLTYSES